MCVVVVVVGCVCVVVVGGGGVPSISFFLLHMIDTSSYCFSLKNISGIPRCVTEAFYRVRNLEGSGGTPPVWGQG